MTEYILPAHCLTDDELRAQALAILEWARESPDVPIPTPLALRWEALLAERGRRKQIGRDTEHAALRQNVGPGHLEA